MSPKIKTKTRWGSLDIYGKFREIERLRSLARHNEASALNHARNEGKIESVITFLEIRLGEVPVTLQKKLRNVRDDGRIETLLKQAAVCQNLKEFQKAL